MTYIMLKPETKQRLFNGEFKDNNPFSGDKETLTFKYDSMRIFSEKHGDSSNYVIEFGYNGEWLAKTEEIPDVYNSHIFNIIGLRGEVDFPINLIKELE